MVSFQNCFIHKSSSRVYKVVWVVSFPRCTVGNNIVGSCCIRLHLTANTDATSPNIAGQQCWKLLRPFVRSLRSHDSDNGEKSGLTIEKNDWHHWLEQLCPWLVRETHILLWKKIQLSAYVFFTLQGSTLRPVGSPMRPGFYSVATKFSRLVANLAPKIGDFLLWEKVH